jgi:metal-dependent amidase/aminoacylase/carboxypeptidase family protein
MILKSESHGESDHMSLTEKVQEKQDEFIAWRRHIHSNPELAFQEFKTTEFIKQKLESWGIETRPNGDKTGVIGTLKGGLPGTKTIALRCDIDALPVTENTGLDFASKNKGVCHACGHDIHTATLLGTAYMLSRRVWRGQNVFCASHSARHSLYAFTVQGQTGRDGALYFSAR